MGAKQSKRSVDISGKEAEGAGEVAAAGAGGEGRVEQLADADALKPQLNGDAHIHEKTEKDKELDSGTPENEKDATTEKEGKEQENEKELEASPVNGDSELKTENGESAATPEDGKKPKKEKVKKKWSLRSISFSRKDKPKQEKKQKEEETKTNGEPEKVPEETAEAAPEPTVNKVAEEEKSPIEANDEKTPETPVTELITNGSSTPESPLVEIPIAEEPIVASPDIDRSEPKIETEPEQLPVNGLSLEETKKEIAETENKPDESVESKPEESIVETTEIVPVPEIPVTKEVCVEKIPLIEPTPPPLPANPPPSSVASFAATTMAPELTDASLSNNAETATSASIPAPAATDIIIDRKHSEPETVLTNIETVSNEFTTSLKTSAENIVIEKLQNELEEKSNEEVVDNTTETIRIDVQNENITTVGTAIVAEIILPPEEVDDSVVVNADVANIDQERVDVTHEQGNEVGLDKMAEHISSVVTLISDTAADIPEDIEDLPPPPPPELDDAVIQDHFVTETNDNDTEVTETIHETKEIIIESNTAAGNEEETQSLDSKNMNDNEATAQENQKNKLKDSLGNVIVTVECNGNIDEPTAEESENVDVTPAIASADSVKLEAGTVAAREEASGRAQAQPADSERGATGDAPQDLLPVSDKMAELIPEVPIVPELKTETLQETSTEVGVSN